MPTPSQTGATVAYFDADDMALADAGTTTSDLDDQGHQVNTAVGANTVKVKVTAPDKTTDEDLHRDRDPRAPHAARRGGAGERDVLRA